MRKNRNEVYSYLAGIIDGEGSIDVSVAIPVKQRKSHSYRIRLKCSMCKDGAIKLLKKEFGGKIFLRTRKNPRHNPLFEWSIRSDLALNALNKILPYLRIKNRQAILAIELHELVSKTILNEKGKQGFQRTSKKESFKRRLLCEKIRKLNARGR